MRVTSRGYAFEPISRTTGTHRRGFANRYRYRGECVADFRALNGRRLLLGRSCASSASSCSLGQPRIYFLLLRGADEAEAFRVYKAAEPKRPDKE